MKTTTIKQIEVAITCHSNKLSAYQSAAHVWEKEVIAGELRSSSARLALLLPARNRDAKVRRSASMAGYLEMAESILDRSAKILDRHFPPAIGIGAA